MAEINIGDHIEVRGNTQDYILSDPEKVYRGKVIGKENGQLLVHLDEPVRLDPGPIHEASVFEKHAKLVRKD